MTEAGRWLQTFQEEAARVRAELRPLPVGTDAQLQHVMQVQQGWHDRLLAHYGPPAARFQREGNPGLQQALTLFLQDLLDSNAIFFQMIQDRRRAEAERQALRKATDNYVQDLQQQTYLNTKRSFEKQNALWTAAFLDQPAPGRFCSACGGHLGPGFTGFSCPHCGSAVRL